MDCAEDEINWVREQARLAGKEHYQLLVAFRAGLVVDAYSYDDFDDRSYECNCPMCTGYGYYWDDDDDFFFD